MDDPLGVITTKRGMALVTPRLGQAGRPAPGSGKRAGQGPPAHVAPDPAGHDRTTSRTAPPETSPNIPERTVLEQALKSKTDPRRVVLIDGQPYLLDIRFRMLQNGDLARAMGFDNEDTTYEFVGNVSEVTRQIGNAVPVNLAAALVRAALETG